MNAAHYLFFGVTAILIALIGAFFALYWPLPMLTARAALGESVLIERDGRTLEYYRAGEGPAVVLLASVGREVSDFNELAAALNAAGFKTLAVEGPGIGRAQAPAEPITLWDLADDVAAVVAAEGDEQVFVIGHAFGNRAARAYAARHGARGVVTLAAGGKVPIADKAMEALLNCFKPWISRSDRRDAVRYGFFAEGNAIPDYWMRGWHSGTLQIQAHATQSTPSEGWWDAGAAPLLVVQGLQDTIAPKEHTADLLKQDLGGRVTVVEIDRAGHALLPEQPDTISKAVIEFLKAH